MPGAPASFNNISSSFKLSLVTSARSIIELEDEFSILLIMHQDIQNQSCPRAHSRNVEHNFQNLKFASRSPPNILYKPSMNETQSLHPQKQQAPHEDSSKTSYQHAYMEMNFSIKTKEENVRYRPAQKEASKVQSKVYFDCFNSYVQFEIKILRQNKVGHPQSHNQKTYQVQISQMNQHRHLATQYHRKILMTRIGERTREIHLLLPKQQPNPPLLVHQNHRFQPTFVSQLLWGPQS